MAFPRAGVVLFLCCFNLASSAKKANEIRGTIVQKSHLSLTYVPTDLAEEATEVYLGGNHIRNLTRGVFHRIPRCSFLDLSYNEITIIESESFEYLHELHVLDLSGNPLTAVRKDMWVGLRSLTTLSIMYTRVVEIDSCGFSHLPKLEILKIDVVQTTVLNYVLLDKSTFPDTPKQPKLQIEQDAPSMTCDPSLCWLKAAEQKALIANYTRNGTRVIPKCANYNDAPWTEVREMMHCNLTVLYTTLAVVGVISLVLLFLVVWRCTGHSCHKIQIHTVTGRFPEKRLMKGAAPRKDRSSAADDIYLISVTTFRDDVKDLDF